MARRATGPLVALSRTALGDTLLSVVHFTPGEFEVLYLRSDLGSDPVGARSAKVAPVENERLGFPTRETYRDLAGAPGVEPHWGYLFTLRAFTDGYLARVVGEQWILVTADAMDVGAFEEIAVAARRALSRTGRRVRSSNRSTEPARFSLPRPAASDRTA